MTKLFSGRTLWMVLLLALVLTVAGCATTSKDLALNPGTAGPAACSGGGTPSPYAPVVCVNDHVTDLPASPDRVHAVKMPAGKRPTVINWFTVTGNHRLSIIFTGAMNCVAQQPECQGSHCVAVVKPDAVVGANCKYNITLLDVNGYHNDPIVEIDVCCP